MVKVSKRGQVTIPVYIRRQLNIQPGDEVKFEIVEGQVRLRVLPAVSKEDHEQEYEETEIEAALGDTIDYLVTQQFFERPNLIVDRTNSIQLKVPGANKVISEMQRIISKTLQKWNEKGFKAFVSELCNYFDADALTILTKVYADAAIALGETADPDKDEDRQFYLTSVLSAILTRERMQVNEILTTIIEEKLESEGVDVDEALDRSTNIGLMDFSLLENLLYLRHMAEKFKIQIDVPYIEQQTERVVKILSGELDPNAQPREFALTRKHVPKRIVE